MATIECPSFLYSTTAVQDPCDDCTRKIRSLNDLCLKSWVSTEDAFYMLSPEVVMFTPYKTTPILTMSGVYDDTELENAEMECITN